MTDARDSAKKTVLVVDDDASQTDQIARYLGRLGVRVEVAQNGFAALAVVRRRKPAVIIMDLRLPGIDGLETANLALRAYGGGRRPRIILMSGYDADVRRATRAGVDVFATVNKPIPLAVLARFVTRALTD